MKLPLLPPAFAFFFSLAIAAGETNSVARSLPRYDGHWWRSVSLREQISFLNGFRDCYVFEHKGPMRYSLVAPFEWQREIAAWYDKTPSALDTPAPEFMLRARALPDQRHIASREDDLGEHGGYDGRFWGAARALGGTNEQRGFIAGYLWCHAGVAKNQGGTFSRPPEEYVPLITQWYDDTSEMAQTQNRAAEKIAHVLFKFRDANPALASIVRDPSIDALLCIHSNFIPAALNPPAKTADQIQAELDRWKAHGHPAFSLSIAPGSVTLAPGSRASVTVRIARLNGFAGAAALSATNLPPGVTASFESLTADQVRLTLSARDRVPAAASTALILGSSPEVPDSAGARAVTLPVVAGNNTAQRAVNLQPVATLYGVGNDRLVLGDNDGIDGAGFCYSGTLLGPGLTWGTNQFAFGLPADGQPGSRNAVTGTTIPLPPGHYSALKMLGSATGGNRLQQTFTITYADGTSATFTQSLSDWTTPQNYPGETTVATNTYCDLHMGTFASNRYLYGYSFPLDSGKIVKSFKMPGTNSSPGVSGVVALAVTLENEGL